MKRKQLVTIKLPGETIIGELVELKMPAGFINTDASATIKNPANLFLQPSGTGQLTVQLLPMIFGELVDPSGRENGVIFTFSLGGGVAFSDSIPYEEKLVDQYERIFNPSKIITPANSGKIVQLFDDVK